MKVEMNTKLIYMQQTFAFQSKSAKSAFLLQDLAQDIITL